MKKTSLYIAIIGICLCSYATTHASSVGDQLQLSGITNIAEPAIDFGVSNPLAEFAENQGNGSNYEIINDTDGHAYTILSGYIFYDPTQGGPPSESFSCTDYATGNNIYIPGFVFSTVYGLTYPYIYHFTGDLHCNDAMTANTGSQSYFLGLEYVDYDTRIGTTTSMLNINWTQPIIAYGFALMFCSFITILWIFKKRI